MKEKELYILLTVIKNNGDVKRLTREGLSYKDVAEMTNKAITDGLIIYGNDSISLSEKGSEILLMLDKRLKQTDKNKWIEPENQSKTSILDKNDVFLPNQNDLSFN
jgi:hypothetical protein